MEIEYIGLSFRYYYLLNWVLMEFVKNLNEEWLEYKFYKGKNIFLVIVLYLVFEIVFGI